MYVLILSLHCGTLNTTYLPSVLVTALSFICAMLSLYPGSKNAASFDLPPVSTAAVCVFSHIMVYKGEPSRRCNEAAVIKLTNLEQTQLNNN